MDSAAYDRLLATLTAFYGDCLFQGYPVTVHPAEGDSLLAGLARQDVAEFALYDAAHLASRQHNRTLTNGRCYVADRLLLDPPRLQGALGHYFDMIATCDALDHELRDYATGRQDDLPLREALHARVPPAAVLQGGAGRCTVIGAAVLTAFYHAGDYRLILAERAPTLATGAGLLHVVPAFVLQPLLDPLAEWSFFQQMIREYGEELFGMAEFDTRQPAPTTLDYIDAHPAIVELTAMLADGRAAWHPTGIAQNLLSTRFELCGLLVIHDPGWYSRHQAALKAASHTERQHTHYIPLSTLAGLPGDLPRRMAPQGAVAWWLGIARLQQMIR
jgi:hypothetical protein